MSFSDRFANVFKRVLPAPFTIAVLLTLLTFLLAFFITRPEDQGAGAYTLQLLEYWEDGLWNSPLLTFALQMMLMLVLGHALALTKPVSAIIQAGTRFCTNTANAAALVTLLTILVSLFNWGLGLIFGAIFARKVAEHAAARNIPLNYPIIGAAGYSGLMVWHGGISGSSLTKIAEDGHIKSLMQGVMSEEQIQQLPNSIGFDQTVFSTMNIIISLALIVLIPLGMYWLGKKSKPGKIALRQSMMKTTEQNVSPVGAERLDHSKLFAILFGVLILGVAFYKAFIKPDDITLKFITPNFINLVLLGLGIALHLSFTNFLKAVDSAISGAAGILIQFPLYFGIMGIMKSSGMVTELSQFFVSISNETTYPIFTFMSAGLVNIFVPSGGGQWAVQGPIIVQAASDLKLLLPKNILALAYGDQVTNMLQPFWALPLLGITGLRAKEILPYTLILFLMGSAIFIVGLLIF